MKRHQMFSSIVSSILTAGFGGSIGLEAPAASCASSLSSNFARMLHLNFKYSQSRVFVRTKVIKISDI